MQNLNIAEFDPLKAEISALVENIKTTVASSTGASGYELMKENKKVLQQKRKATVDLLKEKREASNAYSKGIIAIEKDLLGIIASVEDDLDEKIKAIDNAKKREERKAMLPERREQLASIEEELTDDQILDMDEKAFAQYFTDHRLAYLEAKQAKIDAEAKRIENEKKEAAVALYNKRKDMLIPYWSALHIDHRSADFSELSEESFVIMLNEAKEKFEADEKIRLAGIKEQAEKDAKAKADKAAQDAIDAENARLEQEKKDQKNLERQKRYKQFLVDNGVTAENKDDFFLKNNEDGSIILYKRVAEFKK